MTAVKSAAKQVQEIPVEQLLVSPEETRKTIDQGALRELAASIERGGVQEALIVRPVDAGPGSAVTRFEIVAGQRRWLASKLAGKKACPCIVREMTDDEARELRIVSNLQRQDLAPMEEAEAFGKLLEVPGATIESVAAALAKSPSYVGRRLKLLDAIEPVREALKCGAIEVGHALELARLSQKQQQDLLDYLSVGYSAPDDDEDNDDEVEVVAELAQGRCALCGIDDDELADNELTWANPEHTVCGDPDCVAEARRKRIITTMVPTRTTVAELRGRIARTELRVLRDVPFPLDDELPPMACVACPKRAAGAASLFADIAEDTCTDPECLNAKLRVWVKAQLEAADRAGRKLTMLCDGHVSEKAGVSRWDCVLGAECASQEQAIWVNGTRIGHLVQICRDKKCSEHGTDATAPSKVSGSNGAMTPKLSAAEKARAEAQKAEREKLRKKVESERAYRERLWKALSGAEVPESAERQIAQWACTQIAAQGGGHVARVLGLADDAFDYGKRDGAIVALRARPYKDLLRAAALALVITDLGVSEYSVSLNQKPEGMEEIAKLFGLDIASIRAGKPAKAAPAAPTKKAAAKPVKKKAGALSAAAKKRIAEAQRKRWAAAKTPAKKAAKKGGKR